MNIIRPERGEAAAVAKRLDAELVGHELREVEWRDYDWAFSFTNGVGIRVACPWRIVKDGGISLTDSDHGQKFGLPAPIDGPVECKKLLARRAVQHTNIRKATTDLEIVFDPDITLEIWNNSSGYEGWELYSPRGFHAIAMGGGQLATYEEKQPRS